MEVSSGGMLGACLLASHGHLRTPGNDDHPIRRTRHPSLPVHPTDLVRKMLKIDVTKSGGIFDFLVKQGYLRLSYDQNATAPQPGDVQPGKAGQVNGHGTGVSGDGTQRPATGLNITSMSPSRKMNGVSGLDGA